MPSPTRVVVLRDGGWPRVPGVCCWRSSVQAAFEAVGASVATATYQSARPSPSVTVPAPRSPQRARAAWLPAAARRPLVAAYRGPRLAMSGGARLARRLATAQLRRPVPVIRSSVELAAADLVVAESLAAAGVAAGVGVSRRRLWALALPAERLYAEEVTGYAVELAELAPRVGGFLAGSESDRESVERATSAWPAPVELFPPVAADRPCPVCRDSAAEPGGDLPAEAAVLAGRRTIGTGAAQLRAAEALLAAVLPLAPDGAGPAAPAVPSRSRRRVLLAGYDLKFAAELGEQLDRRTDLAVTVDDWPDLGTPTPHTRSRLRNADAIFAEWARTSAVWLSRQKHPGQFLAMRLHRFELDSRYPREMNIDDIDAVVYIAPLFGTRIRDELGWPVDKLVYIPNYLDVSWLDRSKLPGARFTIGFVGMEWARKRFDLALDLLAGLRREDLRYTMVVRSKLPWQNEFAWSRPAEREFVARCFSRIEQDPLLRQGVVFDPPGRDMARWYRRVGYLASTSDEEGSHASVAEAMASGAVPVVRAWPGAAEVYGKEWIHTSTEEAVATVREGADADIWAERAARARDEIRRTHDPAGVVAAWADLLHGDLAAARRQFAPYAPLMGGT